VLRPLILVMCGTEDDSRVEAAEIAAQFTSMSGDRLRELAR
jgi:hypothetical protein